MTQPTPTEHQPAARIHVTSLLKLSFGHLLLLPGWQKGLLALAAFAGGAGLFARTTAPTPAVAVTSPASSPDALRSVSHSTAFDVHPAMSANPHGAEPPVTTSTISSPWYGRIGISIVLGFIVGWITRMFVKLMAMVAALFAAALGALSYFH